MHEAAKHASYAYLKKERSADSCLQSGGRLDAKGLVLLLLALAAVGAGAEQCEAQDSPGRSLLQAKNTVFKAVHLDSEARQALLESPRHLPGVLEPAELAKGLARRSAAYRIAMSAFSGGLWSVFAVILIAALVTFAVVYHEALRKRFSGFLGRPSQGSSLDSKVPLVPGGSTDFCPELVVPAGCECILIVPSRPRRGEPYGITDNNGSTVLTVADEVNPSCPTPRRLLLAKDGVVLAKCGRAQSSLPSSMPNTIDFELVSSKGDVWAELSYQPREGSEEQDKCTIKSKTGRQFTVAGSVRHNALNFTDGPDGQGGLLATTEPVRTAGPLGHAPGTIFRLRIAPQADVGLVLCALICLQHLTS
mmetsp:Transcript_97235/g.135079  ORF Transcript_97235/g.135079 Transcript_97235/m.135079 type:complete len:363 (+) Transcript_97235:167-1255(+)